MERKEFEERINKLEKWQKVFMIMMIVSSTLMLFFSIYELISKQEIMKFGWYIGLLMWIMFYGIYHIISIEVKNLLIENLIDVSMKSTDLAIQQTMKLLESEVEKSEELYEEK